MGGRGHQVAAREGAKKLCLIAFERPPLRPAHHHLDVPAPAPRANQPRAPIQDRRVGAVPAGLVSGGWLASVTTCLTPDEETEGGPRRRSRASSVGRVGISLRIVVPCHKSRETAPIHSGQCWHNSEGASAPATVGDRRIALRRSAASGHHHGEGRAVCI
jgi:hypothetical protein